MKLALMIIVWACICSAALAGQTRRYYTTGPAPRIVYFMDLTPQPIITRGTICNPPSWRPMAVPFRIGPTSHVSRTYTGNTWPPVMPQAAPQMIINPYVKQ